MNIDNIILIYSYYGVGGAQRRAHNLANKFAENGWHVSIIAAKGADGSIVGDDYYPGHQNVELILLPEYSNAHKNDPAFIKMAADNEKKLKLLQLEQRAAKKFSSGSTRLRDLIRGSKGSVALKYLLSQYENAVVINFGFNIFEATWFAAKNTGIKKLIYAETNAAAKYENDSNYRATCSYVKKASFCVFQTREEMRSHGLTDSPRAAVIHNPVKDVLPERYEGERVKEIVNFCRIVPQKNLLLLIKAFALFREDYPDYRLAVYGDAPGESGEKYLAFLKNYIHENKLENCISFLPAAPDIHERIRDRAMFVCSSDYEGLSNSMVEAMAIGMPCICTDCGGGGAAEMIKDCENGLLTPVGDIQALAGAMKRFAADTAFAEKCGEAAYRVRRELSLDIIAGKWLDIIKKES